jgi:hypothetical protein
MPMSGADLSKYMGIVARRLLGKPNRRLSKRHNLRFGTNGSLSVDLKSGTFYSHEDQQGGGVLDLITRVTGVKGKDAITWMSRELGLDIPDHAGSPRRIVDIYDYCGTDGSLLFQVVRFDPKDFRQRRPDGPNEWVWSVKGVKQVPYRLPELIEAIALEHIVIITEGEKDADALAAWGIPATCNAGGAGKWNPGLGEYLRGANVVILPDNDLPGKKHAIDVAIKLADYTDCVRILELPGLPPKGDVRDWIAAGGTPEALWDLIKTRAVAHTEFEESAATVEGHRTTHDETSEAVSIEDFYAYMPMHSYIFVPTREMWPAVSVNARIGSISVPGPEGPKQWAAAKWLDRNKPIEQMCWAPGQPTLIPNKIIAEGGWIDHNQVTCFNLYRPPTIKAGDATAVGPWIDHVRKVYGADADHIIRFLAHRVRRPHEKINHALVLGGKPGIGKDTLLEPVKYAVGPWNFAEVSPKQVLGRFNGFLKSVIMRISEARDLGDFDRFKFYDHMKALIVTPPDVLRVDEKHLREYPVVNVTAVIITTNHKSDGIYLPPDDRRHFVAWSELAKDDFEPDYWNRFWRWYGDGGIANVTAYLAALDISDFDPKAPPPKTDAFWAIADANRAPEDAELADVLDALGNPDAVTLSQTINGAGDSFHAWLSDRKNRRAIPHRMERCGYVQVRNEAATDGLWKVFGKRQVIYAKSELSARDRIAAANRLMAPSV